MSWFFDAIVDRVLDIVMPKVVKLLDQQNSLKKHGFILQGSWDPTDGTVSVVLSDTIVPVYPDTAIVLTRVPLMTQHTGDQYGPIGDERVTLHRTNAGGWVAMMHHDPFDSIGAPTGERWIVHRNPMSGAIDYMHKMTNDGSTPGDGAVGVVETSASYYSKETTGGHSDVADDKPASSGWTRSTASGHRITMSDVAGALKIETLTASGLQTLHNDATAEIAHIAPHVNMGDIGANMVADVNNAYNQSHITAFESNMFPKRLDDLTKFATAMIAAGVPNSGLVLAQLATLLHIPIPNGSAVVNIKS